VRCSDEGHVSFERQSSVRTGTVDVVVVVDVVVDVVVVGVGTAADVTVVDDGAADATVVDVAGTVGGGLAASAAQAVMRPVVTRSTAPIFTLYRRLDAASG
jgi:hypothetical protein